ncbi:hypothetical protein EV421DRAFT_1742212 [Armillaria borealis]|uniref:Uncharacterized protein n=1 Tax=Armillaria borealis TaxID=47425 RepID=A0AA39MG44_9AGAR|nr:hypothetical protein EV421DRAFT_1742212 [Armillaria borealis]
MANIGDQNTIDALAQKTYLHTHPLFFRLHLPSFLTKTLLLLYLLECSTLVKLSYEHLTHQLCEMAEPFTVKDTTALQHQALSTYEAAATLLQHKARFAPNNHTPHGIDKWISNIYVQWALCDEFWKPAGIKKKIWNDLEYAVLEKVARVDQDDISWAGSDFNELALHTHDYGLCIRPIPLELRTPSPSLTARKPSAPPPLPSKQQLTVPATLLRTATKPTPDLDVPVHKLKLTAPSPDASTSKVQGPAKTALSALAQTALKPPVPNMLTSNINIAKPPVPNPAKPSGQSSMTLQKKPTPWPLNSGTIQSPKATPPSLTMPKQLAAPMKPQSLAQSSGITMVLPTQAGVDNLGWGSPVWSHVSLTDDPSPSPVENSVFFPKDLTLSLHKKLGQQLKSGPPITAVLSEVSVLSSSSRPLAVNAPDRSAVLGPDPSLQSEDEEEEQVQEDSVNGEQVPGTDGEDSYFQAQDYDVPTPPRDVPMDVDKNEGQQSDNDSSPLHPTLQEQNPCHSTHLHTSPINQDVAYLKMTQGSKSDLKKKKKNAKGKENESSSRKRTRNNNDRAQADKPAPKKLKMKNTAADDDEVNQATPAICMCGPTPLKPLPISLGISGGSFSEKVPPSVKPIKNGIESIGVLKVDKDFSRFMEVDGHYWNKDVAPFIREHQPCKVDGEVTLNPVSHYCPKGYDVINTFESTLNAIEINNTAISLIAQQYLAGLNVSAHSKSICIQMSRLHECLNPIEKVVEEEDNGDEDVKVEAVAEGVAGPSKKKAKSG